MNETPRHIPRDGRGIGPRPCRRRAAARSGRRRGGTRPRSRWWRAPTTCRSTSPTRERPRTRPQHELTWASSMPSSRPQGSTSAAPSGRCPVQRGSVIGVNLLGTAAVVRAALSDLAHPGGRGPDCLDARMAGAPRRHGLLRQQFGVVGFARALAAESRGRPGVTCLLPGGMATAFFDGRPERYKPALMQLNDLTVVASSVLFALDQPVGCEVRELLVPAEETSWP